MTRPDGPPSDRQLTLDLAQSESSALDDFVVAPANAAAFAHLMAWPDWLHPATVLSGPAGSGKSHLVRIWAARAGAVRLAAPFSDATAFCPRAPLTAVVEDIDRGGIDEAALFHLHNLCQESGGALLVTSRVPATRLAASLPDLASRLRAATPLAIAAPDDALIEAVLVKVLADRQIEIDVRTAAYAAQRIERSLAAACALGLALDRASLAEKRPITIPLVARLLAVPGQGA